MWAYWASPCDNHMDDSGEEDGPGRHPSDDDEDRLKLPLSPGPRPDSLERPKEGRGVSGVSLYHAEHVAPGSKPLRLEETLYYKELTKILGRVQLTSKQLFYGGDRTALSGMAAEKFWSSLFIIS